MHPQPAPRQSRLTSRAKLLPALLLAIVASIALLTLVASASDQGAAATVYVPMINKGRVSDPGPTTPGPQTPAPQTPVPQTPVPQTPVPETPVPEFVRATFFQETEWKTSSAAIAVDANGGVHMAYDYYEPWYGDSFPNPIHAVYAYCASHCENEQNRRTVDLFQGYDVNEVQIAVTADGRPRVLARVYENGQSYYYAECNQNCTNTAGWTETFVRKAGDTAIFDVRDDDHPQRSFALDPQGRPRFLYISRDYLVEPDRYGTYYMYCDANCTDEANWNEAHIGEHILGTGYYEMFEYPSLDFTSSGQPRVVAAFSPLQSDQISVYYLACDSNCGQEANWQRVRLWDRGQGPNPGWDLEIDSKNRPRIAFYPEYLSDGSGQQLYYASCNSNCLNAANWKLTNLGFGATIGTAPELEFDPGGYPRIAFIDGAGSLGYAECGADCESDPAQWTAVALDTHDTLYEDWPVPFAPTCEGGFWSAWNPVLAFDSEANVRLTYDATYHAKCWWDDDEGEWESYYQYQLIQRAVRGVFYTHQ